MNIPDNAGTKPLSLLIGEMAVIACVQTTALGMTKLDRNASAEADVAHKAKAGTGKLTVSRMPGAEAKVAGIKVVHRQARDLLISFTTQWGADRRLLPNIYIGDFAGEFDSLTREHDTLVGEFVANASTYIAAAKRNLGSYEVEPPTEAEIAGAFSLNFELTPVPDVSSYSIANKEMERQLKARFEDDIKHSYEQAHKDLLKRLAVPLEGLVERMTAYDARERRKKKGGSVDKEGTFKSTVITNITDISAIFRAFNMTNDKALALIADKLDAFDGVEHKDLTASKELRDDMSKRAAEIREMLEPWLG